MTFGTGRVKERKEDVPCSMKRKRNRPLPLPLPLPLPFFFREMFSWCVS